MSDPPTPNSNELLATGGGNATASGVSFQAEVGTLFGVQLLSERRLDARLGLGDVRARSLRFETEAPVDDILVETDVSGWIFVQAKSSLTLSQTSNSEFGRVADQIVRQYHTCAQGTGRRGWDRPLDARRDRILIAVGRGAAASITDRLAAALNAVQAHSTAPIPTNQQSALDSFTGRLQDAWLALTGTALSDGEMRQLLSYVQVCKYDFRGADRRLAIEALRPLIRDEDGRKRARAATRRAASRLPASYPFRPRRQSRLPRRFKSASEGSPFE